MNEPASGSTSADSADAFKPGDERTFEIVPGIRMTFCWIPATTSDSWKRISGGKDTFTMGSPEIESGRALDETPHEVRLTRGFWLGKYEVTQAEWTAVRGDKPSRIIGEDHPVEQVSWDDCRKFIGKLKDHSCRLPTEAEWEYACRAGTTGEYAGELDPAGWYFGNSGNTTHPVGRKEANAWGLCDMHGNVWEWCADWYDGYPEGLTVDPTGPASGEFRVFRGGGWYFVAGDCRSARRGKFIPGGRFFDLGFRLARDNS